MSHRHFHHLPRYPTTPVQFLGGLKHQQHHHQGCRSGIFFSSFSLPFHFLLIIIYVYRMQVAWYGQVYYHYPHPPSLQAQTTPTTTTLAPLRRPYHQQRHMSTTTTKATAAPATAALMAGLGTQLVSGPRYFKIFFYFLLTIIFYMTTYSESGTTASTNGTGQGK